MRAARPEVGHAWPSFRGYELVRWLWLCVQVCPFNAIQGAVGFGGAVPTEPAIYAPNPIRSKRGRSLVY